MSIATGPGWELRLGRWQDVLADVERVDAVITDPPYSERTHSGHNAGPDGRRCDGADARSIEYAPWTVEDIEALAESWARRTQWWALGLIDLHHAEPWAASWRVYGFYSFLPVPFVAPGSRVRLAGDGPSCWTSWIAPSRTKAALKWGTLPGAYILPPGCSERMAIPGAKPLWLMRALVRDYSRPGDLICDPCAGSGTTLLAAVLEGRRAIGAEMDPETFELAVHRLRGEAVVGSGEGKRVQSSFLDRLEADDET